MKYSSTRAAPEQYPSSGAPWPAGFSPDDPAGLLQRAIDGHFEDADPEDIFLGWMITLPDFIHPPAAARRLLKELAASRGGPLPEEARRLKSLLSEVAGRRPRLQAVDSRRPNPEP